QHDEQQSEWTGEERQKEKDGEYPASSRLKGRQREQGEHRTERERECGRKHDTGPEDRERPARVAGGRPPLAPDDDREREDGDADREDGEQLNPDERGERVVDEAVSDERVPARVPEVVPDCEAVLEQERAVVGLRGEGHAGWTEPDEHARKKCRDTGGGDRFTDEQPTSIAAHEREAYSATRSTRDSASTQSRRRPQRLAACEAGTRTRVRSGRVRDTTTDPRPKSAPSLPGVSESRSNLSPKECVPGKRLTRASSTC